MAVTVLSTTYKITSNGPADDNLSISITVERTNGAVPTLTDLQIAQFIRSQLAAFTNQPVKIEKTEVIKTTE